MSNTISEKYHQAYHGANIAAQPPQIFCLLLEPFFCVCQYQHSSHTSYTPGIRPMYCTILHFFLSLYHTHTANKHRRDSAARRSYWGISNWDCGNTENTVSWWQICLPTQCLVGLDGQALFAAC